MLGLPHAVAIHDRLKEQLRAEFPGIDDETLEDTLEGISDLPQMLAAVVRSQIEDATFATALRNRISEMQQRLARIEGRVEKKRLLVASFMEQAELRKLVDPEFTASLRAVPPALILYLEEDIPERFWKPQPAKLDRSGLLAALRSGEAVPGAGLGNGSVTLSVRTR